MAVPNLRKSLSFLLIGLSPKDRRKATRYAPHPPLAIPSQLLPLFPRRTVFVPKTAIQHIGTMNNSSVRPAKIICREHRAIDEAMLEVDLHSLMLNCCNVYFLTETDPEGGAAEAGGDGGAIAGVDEDLDAEHVALKVCFCF